MKKNIDFLYYIRRYEVIIASGAVLLVVIFLTLNMLIPNLNRANQIYVQGQTLKKKLEQLILKERALSSYDYDYYKDIFLKTGQILPENKDYVSLINTFDKLERKSGASITRTDFQLGVVSTSSANLIKVPGTSAFAIPIKVSVLGDLTAIEKFLGLISDYRGRLMVFDNVSVNSKNDTLEAGFSGQAFYYILPATLPPIDSPLPALSAAEQEILEKIILLDLPKETFEELDKGAIGKKNLFQ